jgi:hypothetical protein
VLDEACVEHQFVYHQNRLVKPQAQRDRQRV